SGTPPIFPYGNTGGEGESTLLLIAVRYPAYGVRQGKSWSHAEFSFGFIPDIKKEVSQINGIPPRMI
ncbi:hypothetical protein, partial [Barnesiella intestinihominis]|uniref:hypothetical protein n=1 Tax=Barnesiella intestinihominis TaxID=487174 RepID=UPI003AEFB323